MNISEGAIIESARQWYISLSRIRNLNAQISKLSGEIAHHSAIMEGEGKALISAVGGNDAGDLYIKIDDDVVAVNTNGLKIEPLINAKGTHVIS